MCGCLGLSKNPQQNIFQTQNVANEEQEEDVNPCDSEDFEGVSPCSEEWNDEEDRAIEEMMARIAAEEAEEAKALESE